MSTITTFEILVHEIKQAGGKPIVLEALWDGDTQGWYLLLYLYTTSGSIFNKRQSRHFLGEVAITKGMEHFTNGHWTVAGLANEFGKKAIEKYNLTFFFPSPKDADCSCPKWTDRHTAIHCADCNKLITPTSSPYLPKDICYNCHLTREQDDRVKNAAPCDDGVNMFMYKDNEYLNIGYATNFKDFTIAPFINKKVDEQLGNDGINIVTLHQQDLLELKEKLDLALTEKLAKYTPPKIDERMKPFVSTYKLQYREQEYELMDKFNNDHSEISNFIYSANTVSKALATDFAYCLFFKRGFTYRDDTILRFINYVCNGATTIAAVTNGYANILSANEVLETLQKLTQFHCITINDNDVGITVVGKNIV